jgi:hypothetical protein
MVDRSIRAVRLAAALLFAGTLLAGCATLRPVLEQPKGFAEYRDQSTYRAVSPEGVVVRVRLVANDPPQTLEFWAEALKTQLQKNGYSLVREEAAETRAGKGMLLEWAAPVGQEDWIYLTGIAVIGSRIAIAEAAGSYPSYQKHREALLESLRTLDVR